MVKGRFAPSPSGKMHLGNAWSALLAWLSVRSQKGSMVLRMEDLDPDRCTVAYCAGVAEDLKWLGLDWDETGEDYYQSRRSAFYQAALEQLSATGEVYPCFCTRGQLHAAGAPHATDGTYVYSGTCRNLTQAERQRNATLRRGALRISVPNSTVFFCDGLQGEYSSNLALDCGDFILRRSDGVYAYQLAVVADDAAMGITEVVRGKDLLSSTPRQIFLQQRLGYPTPHYFHVPLLVAPDGRRLSKRDADLSLAALRSTGIRAEEIIGCIAHAAGLVPQRQSIAAKELVADFSWDKIPKNDIVVSPEFIL